jgi:type III secretion system YscQ/HrcQ family protein
VILELDALDRALPFAFEGLETYTREEVVLINWFHCFFPGAKKWREVVQDVFSGLVEKRTGTTIHLVQTSEIEQKQETREYTFEKTELMIGRNPQNDVVLPAKAIGREHFRLFAREGSFYIEDLGSALGTWVNQKRLEPKQAYNLNNGDTIRTFPYSLTFEARSNWEPETDVQFHATPADTAVWEDFLHGSPVGCVSYDVTMNPGAGAIRLQADRPFLVKLISRALREQTSGVLVASDRGVIEFLLLSILERVNGQVLAPFGFSLEQPRYNPAAHARGLSFSFFVGLADLAGTIRVFMPFHTIEKMRTIVPAPAIPSCLLPVTWPFTMTAGNVEFAPDELVTLQMGDAVLFANEPELLFPPTLTGAWPGIGWKGQITGAAPWQFKIDRYFQERSLAMEDSPAAGYQAQNTAEPQETPDLTQLPVRLHVVLGQVDLSLAEISRMMGGTVLELDKAKTDPVHLAVNGKVMGTGELVEIDGKLGVRITGWSGS